MNGTLALWCQRVTPNGEENGTPKVQLHVNLWRDLDKDFNFLDVGFVLENVDDLDRLCLYLPAPITKEAIFDLSGALMDADTLNAVFNDVALIEAKADDHFVVDTEKLVDTEKRLRTIHIIKPQDDIAVHEVNVLGQRLGTTIALNSALCGRIRHDRHGKNEHYVRLRIYLHGEARTLFTTEDTARGMGLSLTQEVSETTEFRLNERRSYPSDILRQASAGKVDLVSVHYFLIRRKDYQLGSQHQNFRKVRYLEHAIWDSYIQIGRPTGRGARRAALSAEGMIIYQWRETAKDDKKLKDFIAYATFKTVRPRILAYVIAAFAIGGVGSAVHNVAVAILQYLFNLPSNGTGSTGWQSFFAGLALGAVAAIPSLIDTARQRWSQRWSHWWRQRWRRR